MPKDLRHLSLCSTEKTPKRDEDILTGIFKCHFVTVTELVEKETVFKGDVIYPSQKIEDEFITTIMFVKCTNFRIVYIFCGNMFGADTARSLAAK